MSIRIKQLRRIGDKVVKELLESGHFPSTTTFLSKMVEKTNNILFGMPTMAIREATHRKLTNNVLMNQTFREAKEDLGALFEEVVDQIDRLIIDYDYKYTWRERIHNRIRDIYTMIQDTKEVPPFRYAKNIASFRGIDTANTDAFVNLREGCIMLPEINTKTIKYDIFDSIIGIKIAGSFMDSKHLTPVNNILDDNLNSAWLYHISAVKTGRVVVSLEVAFPVERKLSKITLIGHSPGPTKVDVLLGDSTVGLGQKPLEMNNLVSWNFASTTVSKVSILLIKDEPDATIENGFKYYFGLRNFGALYTEHKNTATLVTGPITFKDVLPDSLPIGNFKLFTTTERPGENKVKWFYSFSTGLNKEWYPLKEETVVPNMDSTLRQYTTTTITGSVSGNREGVYDRTTYYNLLTIPTTASEVTIRRGKNCWRVDSYIYDYDTDPNNFLEDPVPALTDFIEIRGKDFFNTSTKIKNRYLNVNETNPNLLYPYYEKPKASTNPSDFYMQEKAMHKLTAYVYVKPDLKKSVKERIKNLKIYLPTEMFGPGNDNRNAVYWNGMRLLIIRPSINVVGAGREHIIVSMEDGWNTFEIVMNNYSPRGSLDISLATFSDLINGTNASGIFGALQPVRAIEWWAERYPMTQVTSFELFYQTNRNDHTRFAIKDGKVVINYLPYYEHEVKYKTTNIGVLPKTMYLRAELIGDTRVKNTTPKIFNYRLEMSYE